MGYNFRFLSCSVTCRPGRQALLEGATFRVFTLRERPASQRPRAKYSDAVYRPFTFVIPVRYRLAASSCPRGSAWCGRS